MKIKLKLKTKWYYLFAAIFMCFMLTGPLLVSAASAPLLVDDAKLLSDSEANSLKESLNDISSRHNMDVAVIIKKNMGEYTDIQDFADDYYDNNGYADNGIALVISMEERKWQITTKGTGVKDFTDAGLKYMKDQFLDDLSDGEYADAFQTFADQCDAFITQAEKGEPYDVGNMPKKPLSPIWILVSIGAGLVIALIVTGSMKADLKSVAVKETASDYVRRDSLRLTRSREIFLYRNITRTEKPKDNDRGGSSTHTSSSGDTHGGIGGSF